MLDALRDVEAVDVARILVGAGDKFSALLRGALVAYSAFMVTILAAIVLGEKARNGAFTPEEIETVGTMLQAAAYVVSAYPLVAVLAWFGRQFLAWYDVDDAPEVAADA